VFSVMWSEHCSYKSSSDSPETSANGRRTRHRATGENAGVVDVGDGWCRGVQIESHNHPSFIEPFQGAATGVGRNPARHFHHGRAPDRGDEQFALRLARRSEERAAQSFAARGVVAGIAHYGNAFGVPTVGRRSFFRRCIRAESAYQCFRARPGGAKIKSFSAKPRGSAIRFCMSEAKTGRDGIHGATMASAEFDEEALEKRPTVQVGDPFLEKLLLEACLESDAQRRRRRHPGHGRRRLDLLDLRDGRARGYRIEIMSLVPQRETGMNCLRNAAFGIAGAHADRRACRAASAKSPTSFASGTSTQWSSAAWRDDGRMRVSHNGEVVLRCAGERAD